MNKYFCQDITFCSKHNCENKKCIRNRIHIDWSVKPFHSFADFENTQYCLDKNILSEKEEDIVNETQRRKQST